MKAISLIGAILFSSLVFGGCGRSATNSNTTTSSEFIELRIHRWLALDGGEILVMRKNDGSWTSMLLGDGSRLSCMYQKNVRPKQDIEQLWKSFVAEGLLDIPDGRQPLIVQDGNGFDVEITYQGKLHYFSIPHPKEQKTDEGLRILKIDDLISQQFDTPIFSADYSRSVVGDYVITQCKDGLNK